MKVYTQASEGLIVDCVIQDSVAIAITWALCELVRHPSILWELRAEISAA